MKSIEHGTDDTMAKRAAEIAASSEEAWQEYCQTNAMNVDQLKIADFYYPIADKVSTSYGYSVGYRDPAKEEFVNYELHQGFGPSSALFALMNNPARGELLDHLILARAKDFSDLAPELREVAVDSHKFPGENEAICELYEKDPQLVDRLVLTRTVGDRPGMQDALDNTQEFLQFAIDGHKEEELEYYSKQDLKDLEELIAPNLMRERSYKGQLQMIDQLVAEGVQPLTPEELLTLVDTYLSDLIRQDEDRLNPYSKHKPTTKLAGTVALSAWFEQRKGK